MRRRLYFVLPDIQSAREMLDEMLLARIECRHIHFLAQRGTLPPELPEANVLQKTDVVHGAQLGVAIGAIVGMVAGGLLVLFPPEGVTLKLITVLVTALGGAFFGAWASSLVASSVPNSRLKGFAARNRKRQGADDGRRADAARAGDLRARDEPPSGSGFRRLRADHPRVSVTSSRPQGVRVTNRGKPRFPSVTLTGREAIFRSSQRLRRPEFLCVAGVCSACTARLSVSRLPLADAERVQMPQRIEQIIGVRAARAGALRDRARDVLERRAGPRNPRCSRSATNVSASTRLPSASTGTTTRVVDELRHLARPQRISSTRRDCVFGDEKRHSAAASRRGRARARARAFGRAAITRRVHAEGAMVAMQHSAGTDRTNANPGST